LAAGEIGRTLGLRVPIGQLSQSERFHWLVAPRSTTIQISPVHCGLCANPQAALDSLFEKLIR
jgi:hypothetical protein